MFSVKYPLGKKLGRDKGLQLWTLGCKPEFLNLQSEISNLQSSIPGLIQG